MSIRYVEFGCFYRAWTFDYLIHSKNHVNLKRSSEVDYMHLFLNQNDAFINTLQNLERFSEITDPANSATLFFCISKVFGIRNLESLSALKFLKNSWI